MKSSSHHWTLAPALVAWLGIVSQSSGQSNLIYTPYTFATLAGACGYGSADGTGAVAQFYNPVGIASDSAGNIYLADSGNSTVRKISTGGVVTTLAGMAGNLGSADGTGSAARLRYPAGLGLDNVGTLYVADPENGTIRKITAEGVVTTFAAAGTVGFFPLGVAVDRFGAVYVVGPHVVQKISPEGAVSTLAGGHYGNADGSGSNAQFNEPHGVAVDDALNVYVADTGNKTIRKVTQAGMVTTFAGMAMVSGTNDGLGSDARFNNPNGLAVDANGNVYVADTANRTIRKVTPLGAVTTIAGLAETQGSADGVGSDARFRSPQQLALDSAGNIYVSDTHNHTIRRITASGEVTTLAGVALISNGSVDGAGGLARFSGPSGLAVDAASNTYVADQYNNTIRKISPVQVVTTLAGSAGFRGTNDGIGSNAQFNNPSSVAVDRAGTLYVADQGNGTIRKITADGTVSTLAGSAYPSVGDPGADGAGSAARFDNPSGVAVDQAGNVYVADTSNNTIRKITPTGVVTTLAGLSGFNRGTNDGLGSAARFYGPSAVAVDRNGNVYVADKDNFTIRKITPGGMVTSLAGSAGKGDTVDGVGSSARFAGPSGLAVDAAGNVYVADADANTIRKITPAGLVTTLGGVPAERGGADGTGNNAWFTWPYGVATDTAGNIYVAEAVNNTIRRGHPQNVPAILVGSGPTFGFSGTHFGFTLFGPAGQIVVVESSSIDLRNWLPIWTNTFSGPLTFLDAQSGGDRNRFYRARTP